MKQKALRYIEFGENSIEALYSHISIGEYYILSDMPDSALRHFNIAKMIQKGKTLESEVKDRLSIGIAESLVSKKEITSVSDIMKEALKHEIKDPNLAFRRDLSPASQDSSLPSEKTSVI